MIAKDSRLKAAPHVHARPLQGELVVLDLERGHYYGLDAIGASLWDGLMRGESPEQIASGLVSEYDVDAAQLTRDLVNLAQDLFDKGLLVARSS